MTLLKELYDVRVSILFQTEDLSFLHEAPGGATNSDDSQTEPDDRREETLSE